MSLNLNKAILQVELVAEELERLHGYTPDHTLTTSRGNNAEIAQVARELLRLADQLALAEQLVRTQYWSLKDMEKA